MILDDKLSSIKISSRPKEGWLKEIRKAMGMYERVLGKKRGLDRSTIAESRASFRLDSLKLEEIVIRFHHGLVWIHSFPNGNGRHSRLAADLLLYGKSKKRFFWGSQIVFGDYGEFPRHTKTSLIEMVEDKIFYYYPKIRDEKEAYLIFMKNAGPYWFSIIAQEDGEILNPKSLSISIPVRAPWVKSLKSLEICLR